MLTSTRRKRIGALIATTIAMTGVAVGTASSASAYGVAQTNEFKLLGGGFDFGGSSFSDGDPDDPAVLSWTTTWYGVLPRLDGTLHVEGVSNQCARLKVVSYDEDGSVISPIDYSAEHCSSDLNHTSLDVTVGSIGNGSTASVKVILQSRHDITGDPWDKVTSKRFDYGPVLQVDDVQIKRAEAKFGDGGWDGNGPADSGTLTWNVDGARPWVNLEGTMYAVSLEERCLRMRLKLISSTYGVRDNVYGQETCFEDDEQHTVPIDLGSYLDADSYVDTVKVIIQRRPDGGTWENAGQKTYTLP